MIPSRLIQALWDKANASGSDLMRWSDLLDVIEELKISDTTALTVQPTALYGLPEYADEAAAVTGGLNGGELYQTSTGEVRIKLPSV